MHVVDHELAQLGAILVEERVLRRIIKHHRGVRGVGLAVPHEQCYMLRRGELEALVDRGELGADLAALPDHVAVVHGSRGELAAGAPEVLSKLWRAIFHARVHQAFDDLVASQALTSAAIRERVHRVGQTEFDEIRSVLKQEDLLLPPIDDTSTYVEFVALYLELRHFAPSALARTFPAVFDTRHIDATIELDVDPAALLAASRPPRAPAHPVVVAVEPPRPEVKRLEVAIPSARKVAVRVRAKGNRSRAAILAARSGDLAGARGDLDELAARLSRALGGPSTAGWVEALLPVAHFAATQRSLRFNAGARLLHDLQSACTVAEREVKVVDVIGWVLARGKRPIVRPLPATREVRIAKHVHAAVAKIAACELATHEDRERLARVLHELAAHADEQLRGKLRPAIEAALDAVDVHPHSLPERVAEKRLVDELLDRAVAVGRLSLGDLRDALSRNDLKLPDLELADLRRGDQLLRADQALAHSLDGVYRRGESYMRVLQKLSSLLFGTALGRLVTLYVLLPLLGSFAVVEGLQHMIGPLAHKLFGIEPQIASSYTLYGGAGFLFLVLHLRLFRRGVVLVVRGVWRLVRLIVFDGPRALWRIPVVRWLFTSWIMRWVVKPAVPAAIAAAVTWNVIDPVRWAIAGGVFAAVAVAMNSRFGRIAEEIAADWLVRSGRQVTSRIVPGLVKYVLELFARLVESLDRGIYRVDEWLRFRTGQSSIKLVVKGVFGTVWFVVTYLLRLYVNLFVEPTTNPIKHFPVVTVAAKIILPFIPSILDAVAGPATLLMGGKIGNGFAAFTVLVLPGLAGFLVWELKENWKLYRATRSKVLRPLPIGHHGETVARLLRRGFHSGTIPKLFTKLRRAAWRGDTRAASRAKEGLHHVEEAVVKFVDRQLVSMLNEVGSFRATDVASRHVEIGSNRIQIALVCPSIAPAPATLRFELQSGWLVASLPELGWIEQLADDQQRIFEIALAGFYKLSAIDIVREQVELALQGTAATPAPPYDIADEGLVVWPGQGFEIEVVYDLRSAALEPAVRRAEDHGEPIDPGVQIDLDGRHALFGREPVYWSVWSTTWQQIARGEQPMQIMVGPSLLRPAAARRVTGPGGPADRPAGSAHPAA